MDCVPVRARGHFLLHLPGAFLRGRRLPRKGEAQAGSFVLRLPVSNMDAAELCVVKCASDAEAALKKIVKKKP